MTVWTTAATAPYVELGVHDSGKGIPEADLGRVFEPFFTTKVDGLGMGLAISHTIVEAHGGRLLVENDPAGGAIFRVHLRTDGNRRHPGAVDSYFVSSRRAAASPDALSPATREAPRFGRANPVAGGRREPFRALCSRELEHFFRSPAKRR